MQAAMAYTGHFLSSQAYYELRAASPTFLFLLHRFADTPPRAISASGQQKMTGIAASFRLRIAAFLREISARADTARADADRNGFGRLAADFTMKAQGASTPGASYIGARARARLSHEAPHFRFDGWRWAGIDALTIAAR